MIDRPKQSSEDMTSVLTTARDNEFVDEMNK